MKRINNFSKFLFESQSKKIKKYVDFSTVLAWYRDNKNKIAEILKVNPEEMVSEDELLNQSHGLLKHVINRQSSGTYDVNLSQGENEDAYDKKLQKRISNNERPVEGFYKFNPLDKNIIHDILHNIYNVKEKEFEKSLTNLEYSESEIIEEIECLAIEESFMKYLNIRYVKTDFINQNINMLVSYLLMTILKYDTQRIVDILEGKVEPYIEVYGKKYPVANTPFHQMFDLFTNDDSDSKFVINSEKDLREYLIHLINVGYGIMTSSGNRGQYPNSDFYGTKSFYDLDDEQEYFYKKVFEDYIVFKIEDYYTLSELKELSLLKELRPFMNITDEGEEEDGDGIDYEEFIDNPNQLKFNFEKQHESVSGGYLNIKTYLKYKLELMERKGVDVESPEEYIVEFSDEKHLFFNKSNLNLITKSVIEEEARDEYESGDGYNFDNEHKFINFKEYNNKTTKELVDLVLRDEDSKAIMRRNFRTNDVVKNNTKLGKASIFSGNIGGDDKYKYIDFEGKYDTKHLDFTTSLSKNIFTDSGKQLMKVLASLRGYVIKNVDKIKAESKDKKSKFTKEDIQAFINASIESTKEYKTYGSKIGDIKKVLSTITIEELYIKDDIDIDIVDIYKETEYIKKYLTLLTKIEDQSDIDYLFNWANKKDIKNYTDFKEFRDLFKDGIIKKIVDYIDNLSDKDKAVIEFIQNLYRLSTTYLWKVEWKEIKSVDDIKNVIINKIKSDAPDLIKDKLDIKIQLADDEISEFIRRPSSISLPSLAKTIIIKIK